MHDKVSSRQTESNVSLEPTCLESTDTDDSTTTELSKEEPIKRKNSENPHGKGKRAKQDLGLAVDAMLLSTIKDISQNEKKNTETSINEDADSLFCRSCVDTLKRLPPKKNSEAKMKIQQLLHNIEFSD